MILNRRYLRITLSVLIATLLVSTVLGLREPRDVEESDRLMREDIPEIDKQTIEEYRTASFGVKCFWGPDARLGVVDGVIRTRIGYWEVDNSTLDERGLHRELVQVDYDPEKISYIELYKTLDDIATLKELVPLGNFVLANKTLQKYYLRQNEYLDEAFKDIYPDEEDFLNSTAVARVNGYLIGYGQLESPDDLEGLGLTVKGKQMVYESWLSNEEVGEGCYIP